MKISIMPDWECAMYSAVRTAERESKYDLVNLYIKLERMSKKYLASGEMEEGSAFKIPMEDGSWFTQRFYKDYSTADYQNGKGISKNVINRQDSYRKEYRFLEGISFALEGNDLGIGPKYSDEYVRYLSNLKVGDIIVFENNKSYVCEYNDGRDLELVRTHGMDKTPKIEEIENSEKVYIGLNNLKELQKFYSDVRDRYTCSFKVKMTTMNDARAILNKLLINRKDSKTLKIGPNEFMVLPSKEGKGVVFYDKKGNLVPEDKMLYLIGWLEAAPNKIDIERLSEKTPVAEYTDDVLMNYLENAISNRGSGFLEAAIAMEEYCLSHEGAVKFNMSSYIKDGDNYKAVTFVLENVDGKVKGKMFTYRDDDFSKDVDSVKEISVEDIAKFFEEKYTENYSIIKSEMINEIMKIHTSWKMENIERYIEPLVHERMKKEFNIDVSDVKTEKEEDFLDFLGKD